MGSLLVRRLLKRRSDHKFILFNSTPTKDFTVFSQKLCVRSAHCLKSLLKCNIIITAQGSEYSSHIIHSLRRFNWKGYWIDASSVLRREHNAVVVLDPVNFSLILRSLGRSIRTFVGGNCTVSLMLLGIKNVSKQNLFTALFITTLQSASGAGIRYVNTVLNQTRLLASSRTDDVLFSNHSALPLALAVTPWIDSETGRRGTSREEQKGYVETLRITNTNCQNVIIGSVCVRVSVLRCHAQSLLLKLTAIMSAGYVADIIQSATRWIKLIPNASELSKLYLNPHYTSNTLIICIGRMKKVASSYLSAFTIGDQLLWGASEPISRIVSFMISRHSE